MHRITRTLHNSALCSDDLRGSPGETDLDAFSIEAEVRGIAYSNSHYYDYIGRLRVNPIPLVFIAAGYRAEKLLRSTKAM